MINLEAQIQELRDLPAEVLQKVPGYLTRREEDLVMMSRSFLDQDYQKILDIVHKIKGSSPSYGLSPLAEIAKKLEFHCAEQSSAKIAVDLEAFDQTLKKLFGVVSTVVKTT